MQGPDSKLPRSSSGRSEDGGPQLQERASSTATSTTQPEQHVKADVGPVRSDSSLAHAAAAGASRHEPPPPSPSPPPPGSQSHDPFEGQRPWGLTRTFSEQVRLLSILDAGVMMPNTLRSMPLRCIPRTAGAPARPLRRPPGLVHGPARPPPRPDHGMGAGRGWAQL